MGRKGKSEKETPEELRARTLLERELGCQLVRVRPGALPTVDHRAPAGEAGIEVKRVTGADYHDLTSAWAKITHFDSRLLTGRWSAAVDRPTLSTTPAPVPDFPADDSEAIAYWEGLGFKVQRRAERVAEWRATHPGPHRATPRLDTLARDLEPHLVVLEAHGLTTTRGAAPFLEPEPLASALRATQERTQGALCLRHEVFGQQRAGIDVVLSAGFIRTGRPDTIPQRLELWLGSPMSANLRVSLRNEPGGTERHAVLVFDAQTEPEYQSAVEQGTEFCPSADLDLPEEISVLWFILGPIACRFRPEDGWRTIAMPDSPAT